MAVTIDSSPETVNFIGLTAGTRWINLAWAIGTRTDPAQPSVPTDLTGKAVRLLVNGVLVTTTNNSPTGLVSWRPSATVTAAFSWTSANYLLLIDDETEVRGILRIDARLP